MHTIDEIIVIVLFLPKTPTIIPKKISLTAQIISSSDPIKSPYF